MRIRRGSALVLPKVSLADLIRCGGPSIPVVVGLRRPAKCKEIARRQPKLLRVSMASGRQNCRQFTPGVLSVFPDCWGGVAAPQAATPKIPIVYGIHIVFNANILAFGASAVPAGKVVSPFLSGRLRRHWCAPRLRSALRLHFQVGNHGQRTFLIRLRR